MGLSVSMQDKDTQQDRKFKIDWRAHQAIAVTMGRFLKNDGGIQEPEYRFVRNSLTSKKKE